MLYIGDSAAHKVVLYHLFSYAKLALPNKCLSFLVDNKANQ